MMHSFLPRLLPVVRTMSTAPSTGLHKFLVYAPDKIGMNRYNVRSEHLEKISPLIQSGVVSECN